MLLRQAVESVVNITIAQRRGHRQQGDDLAKRAERAQSFVMMGEVSSGRQALEGEALALGTDTALNMLEDPERRPPNPIIEIPQEMMEHWPVEDFALDPDKFVRNFSFSQERCSTRAIWHDKRALTASVVPPERRSPDW